MNRSLVLLLLLTATTLPAQGTAVSPADRAGLEGSHSTVYPLGRFNARVQTMHADLPGTLTQIQGHAYRRDAATVRGQVAGFATEMEVTLSIAPHGPGQASTTFANNVGSNPVTVLPRTFLSFPATNRPLQDPAPTFELVVPYAVPYTIPVGSGTLCIDTVVYGNVTPGGTNTNFNPLLDAHQVLGNGSNLQPGFRSGQGCPAPGSSAPMYGSFTFDLDGAGNLDLKIALRKGIQDPGTGSAVSFLMAGGLPVQVPFPGLPGCDLLTSLDHWQILPGTNGTNGAWNGTVTAPPLPPGLRLYLQGGSADPVQKAVVFGDQSGITVPPSGPSTVTAVRIAHGGDHLSPTGTVSPNVPVISFF